MRRFALAALALPLAAAAGGLDELRLDLQVPDIPALTAVGASATNVSRPGTVRELATALISGVGLDGAVQSGVAIEVAPLRMAFGERSAEGVLGILAPLRISLASRTATGAIGSTTQVSSAVRWSAFSYDPVADPMLAGCIIELSRRPDALKDGGSAGLPGDLEGAPPATGQLPDIDGRADARLRNLESRIAAVEGIARSLDAQRCRDAFRQAHLGTAALEVAFAHVVQATGAPYVTAFSAATTSLWASGSWPIWSERLRILESHRPKFNQQHLRQEEWKELAGSLSATSGLAVELIGYARMDLERTPAEYRRRTNVFGAVRLPLVWDGFSVFGEIGFEATDLAQVAATTGLTYPAGIGADLRIYNGTWIGFYAGTELGKEAAIKVLSNIKWAFGEARPYAY